MADLPQDPDVSGLPRRRASVAFLAGLALLGFLVVSAARQERPGPRLARKGRLVSLIRLQDQRTAALRADVDALAKQLAELEGRAGGSRKRVDAIRAQADVLAEFAGVAAVEGPGVRVVLRDSTLRESPTGDPNDLVIHEQDLQSVVNALWTGGAEAIVINGERITALSAIRCVGNTLLLHGSVYSPPYRISAIGNATTMLAAMDADDGVERLRIVAEQFKVGIAVSRERMLSLPGYRGSTGMRYANTISRSRRR